MRLGRLKDRGSVFMGRSYSISLVTKSRIGASLFLSRWLCGSGAGSEVPSGQSRFCFPQMDADKGADLRRSGLMKGHVEPAQGTAGLSRTLCPFTNFDKTDPYNSGAGVESTPPALLLWSGRGNKEM